MIYISHRGNLFGPKPEKENSPTYIEAAIQEGYDVEIDVWTTPNGTFLGHDEPTYLIDIEFLLKHNKSLWCHAKNHQALELLGKEHLHYFWHQNDDYTLTSKGYPWVYPGKPLLSTSIAVKPEGFYTSNQLSFCLGICSDFITDFRLS